METVLRYIGVLLLTALLAPAQTRVMPVREVRAGMKGFGLTVFAGEKVEQFDVEILGVLENAGPKQAVILARLSGGPMAHTGVMQGMSGSPVYINGRLLGAVALAFTLSKDPIAGIRPFEEMLEAKALDRPRLAQACAGAAVIGQGGCLSPAPANASAFQFGDARLAEIATPVSFSGFTQQTLEAFAPQLRAMGLEPRQGVSGGGSSRLPAGDPRALKPGSMISVQLVSGDMAIGADGTVTHIEGQRVYAFGHRFVSLGEVEMPFAAAEVLTLLPNLSTSFKISAPRRLLGTITNDYSTAVRGELGRTASTMPVSIAVKSGKRESHYQIQMVRDATMTPFLLQVAVFSALDATERTVGGMSFRMRQKIAFDGAPPVESRNTFSGEFNIPMIAAQNVAIPIAYAMQTGFAELRPKAIEVEIDASARKNQLTVEEFVAARRTVRPGDTVPLLVTLASEGKRVTRQVSYKVPESAPNGTLNFTVADALVTNFSEFRNAVTTPPRSPDQVLRLLRELRENNKVFIRVWRADPAYQAGGTELPDPPPSIALILSRSQGVNAASFTGSKVAEIEIDGGGAMISGSKTASVEVKE